MFKPVAYADLNSRQQENYNFQKVAARLADYGYNCIRLSDDFEGADFIALHADGETMLRVQLKGRFSFNAKYYGKGLHIAFREVDRFYVYPHDQLRQRIIDQGLLETSKSKPWIEDGSRNWPSVPKKFRRLLDDYEV